MDIRIASSDWDALVRALLVRRDVETAGFVFAERVLGTDDVLVARRAFVVDEAAYRIRNSDRLQLDPELFHAATREARQRGWSVFTVHTHPGADDAWFSWADDQGDARLMPALAVQIEDVPHGSIVVAGSGRTAARSFLADRVLPAAVRGVGVCLSEPTTASETAFAGADRHARQVLALGAAGQDRLSRTRVGVVGLGGTGSAVSAQLAHLGVAHLTLLDGDALEPSNVSRVFGTTDDDIGTLKVDLAARYASGLGVPVTTVPRMLASQADLGALARCDVIFSCVDRHTPRAWLNRHAYASLVPTIDVGTGFRVDRRGALVGDAGRVVVVGPGRPCMVCWELIDPERLRVEALPADERREQEAAGYIAGATEAQPSVIPFNTLVASAGLVELLRVVTGFGGTEDPPNRLAFSFSAGSTRRIRCPSGPPCPVCGHGAPKVA